jgi:hypothetical protein
MWNKLAVAMVTALVVTICAVWAQPVTQQTISGNECWNAGQGPGGPSQFLCINQVRNGTALNIFSGSGAFTTTATQANGTLMWSGTAPTTWTVTLASPAFDGQIVSLATDTTLTTMVTVNAGTGQTLNGTYSAQTLTANTSVEFQYNASGSKWYRIR